jgi:hypothetical protein
MSKSDDEAISLAFADMAMHGRGFTRMTAEGIKHIPFHDVVRPVPDKSKTPYGEMCRDPSACAGKGYCPKDPTCGD